MSYNKLLITLVISAGLASCTEEIPFDLNEEGFDRLVVEGFFTDQEKAHEVKISRTTSYFNEEQPDVVSGAIVTISNDLDTWALSEDPVGSGRYYTPSDAAGTVGLEHQLRIEIDDEVYVAIDVMPSVVTVDSMRVEFVEFEEGEEDEEEEFTGYWDVLLWTNEAIGTEDFYRWRTLINGVTDGDTTRYSSFANDVGFDGAVLEGISIESYSEDAMMPGDTITLEQHGISEDYYLMIQAVLEQTEFQGGLFDPPPANVPSNVSNGALGFFAASSVSEKTYVIPE